MTVGEIKKPRLLWPVEAMHVDEGLLPLVHRSCSENHPRTVTGVMEAAGLQHHRSFNLAVNPDLDRARLAYVLRLDDAEISKRCCDPIVSPGTTPLVSFFGATVAAYDLKFRRRAVSCQALADADYHRALWQHGLVPFCHESGEWLIDRCPRCDQRLDWYHTGGASRCGNEECKFDLRDFRGLRIDEERYLLVAPIIRLLDPRPEIHSEALCALPADFQTIGRGAAFELIWRIGRWTRPRGMEARDEHAQMDREDIVETMCRGVSMLDDWPKSIVTFVQEIARMLGPEATFRLTQGLRSLARSRSAWDSHRQLIEEAVPELLGTNRRTFINMQDDGVDAAEATRTLGTTASNLVRLARKGTIEAQANTGSKHVCAIYSKQQLRDLAPYFRDRMSPNAACEAMGITAHAVEQLVCLNLLQPITEACVQEVYPGLNLSKAGYSILLERLERVASPALSSDRDAVPLRRAMVTLGGREKPWGPVIAAMLDGSIKYGLQEKVGRFSGRILIAASDVAQIMDMKFDRSAFEFPFADVITRRDAQETLNLTPHLMARALDAELKPSITQGGGLSLQPVLQLARLRISGGEVLARWGRGRRLPKPLQDDRRFPRLGASGWHRSDVERAMADADRLNNFAIEH